MTVERILENLQRVREQGPRRWTACCPAHDDRTPSLSIREMPDGRILCHCFAGCTVDQVVAAVGLSLADLYPEEQRRRHTRNMHERRHSPRYVLRAIHEEVLLLLLAFEDAMRGKSMSVEDRARARKAALCIRTTIEEAGYGH